MSDQNDSETADRRLIREAREEAWHARRALRRELPSPSVPAKRSLACALADFRDLLVDHHDARALETPWDERPVDVDVVDELLTRTTTTERRLPRRGAPKQVEEVQLVATVDSRVLIEIAKELDQIALELGFAATPDQPTPEDEASMSDLRGLLKARDQSEAMDKLPDGDSSEMPNITEDDG
jgi:hypothetical protein